ncbi:MAG: hypothetical protein JWQ40_660 [Segetibacter sp.]|nr:hypothetical protein [Segetibacter sp.]
MIKLLKLPVVALAATLIVSTAFAQDKKDKIAKSKDDKTQEIVIRKKNGKTEKMTIVVDGDNVTINGKSLENYKNDDVTVLKRERPLAVIAPPRIKSFSGPRPEFNFEEFDHLIPATANRALLGVMTKKTDDGVQVTEITKESAAEKAGLQKDDVITKIGNTAVKTPRELVDAINGYKPDDKVEISYKRNGKEEKTTATLGENKIRNFSFNMNNDNFNFDMPRGGFPGADNFNLAFNRRPKIGLQIQDVEAGKGVTVKDVDDDSPAAKAGIKEGDVITQVNGKDVAGVDELRNEIRDVKEGDTVKFTYKRDGKTDTSEIKIPKRLKSADL